MEYKNTFKTALVVVSDERVNQYKMEHYQQKRDAVSMLAQRRRRWANIETALGECPVFAGDRFKAII